MSVLNSVSTLMRALAVYFNDSGHVPLSECLLSALSPFWQGLVSLLLTVFGCSGVFCSFGGLWLLSKSSWCDSSGPGRS